MRFALTRVERLLNLNDNVMTLDQAFDAHQTISTLRYSTTSGGVVTASSAFAAAQLSAARLGQFVKNNVAVVDSTNFVVPHDTATPEEAAAINNCRKQFFGYSALCQNIATRMSGKDSSLRGFWFMRFHQYSRLNKLDWHKNIFPQLSD